MPRVLLTGMSGAGKTTVLDELRRRGHLTVDTDYDGWELPDGTWDEDRMAALLAAAPDVVVSGTVSNQGRFYDRFEHVVLLSAPVDVLLERVRRRTNNPYGTTEGSRPRSLSTRARSSRGCGRAQPSSWTADGPCRSWPTWSRRWSAADGSTAPGALLLRRQREEHRRARGVLRVARRAASWSAPAAGRRWRRPGSTSSRRARAR